MEKLAIKDNQASVYLGGKDNTSQFPEQARTKLYEGVELNEQEQQYMLPHFLMLLIGKPGSGKTTMMKHLVLDEELYRDKFDKLLMISPSVQKTGIPISPEDTSTQFSLFWIYEKLSTINSSEKEVIARIQEQNFSSQEGTMSENEDVPVFTSQSNGKVVKPPKSNTFRVSEMVNKSLPNSLDVAVSGGGGFSMNSMDRLNVLPEIRNALDLKPSMRSGKSSLMYEARVHMMQNKQLLRIDKMNQRERLFGPPTVANNRKKQNLKNIITSQRKAINGEIHTLSNKEVKQTQEDSFGSFVEQASDIEHLFMKHATVQQRQAYRVNVLLVLDDVIGPIKELENDQYLAQLFFNRRHLIANGTVSIVLLSEKYTMIPQRVRSNANWLLTFRLNPVDFESMFRDIFNGSRKQWDSLLHFVFGDEEENMIELSNQRRGKTFDNLSILTERDTYFKNFAQIIFERGKAVDTENFNIN